jgi:hypothetical protein
MDRVDPTISVHLDIDDYEPRLVAFDTTIQPNRFQEWSVSTERKGLPYGDWDQFGNFWFTECTAKSVAEYWKRQRDKR